MCSTQSLLLFFFFERVASHSSCSRSNFPFFAFLAFYFRVFRSVFAFLSFVRFFLTFRFASVQSRRTFYGWQTFNSLSFLFQVESFSLLPVRLVSSIRPYFVIRSALYRTNRGESNRQQTKQTVSAGFSSSPPPFTCLLPQSRQRLLACLSHKLGKQSLRWSNLFARFSWFTTIKWLLFFRFAPVPPVHLSSVKHNICAILSSRNSCTQVVCFLWISIWLMHETFLSLSRSRPLLLSLFRTTHTCQISGIFTQQRKQK